MSDLKLEGTGVKIEEIDVSFRNNWGKPIHRWYHFHAGCSFLYPERMFEKLRIRKESLIFDPFVGSGTILVSAKVRGLNSIGFDVNPLYVLISRVKTYWEFDLNDLGYKIELFEGFIL